MIRNFNKQDIDEIMNIWLKTNKKAHNFILDKEYFDRNFKKINLEWGFKMDDGYVEKPRRFEEMISCAEKLSKGMPHVRVDLYLCDDKIYFGEFTFFDGGGFEKMSPAMYDSKFGDLIDLNNI